MMNNFSRLLLGILFLLAAGTVAGDELEADRQRIEEALKAVNPDIRVDQVQPSPVEGLYQVVIGGQVVYVSADGRYLLQGDMLDLERRQSVSDTLRSEARRERIEAHGSENMIIYEAEGETRHVVTVFTDIDCPYCRQMHERIGEYTGGGIEVRYIQMPRAGEGSESYRKAVAVWCASDRKAAMDRAKQGESMGGADCDNPVASQLQLARDLGVNATPTFITEQGTMRRGLVGAEELLEMLDEEKRGAER